MKILLADGDLLFNDVTAYTLSRHGHSVIRALDGNQAWHRWLIDSPDLVLVDVASPNFDGLDLCRRVREASTTAPIILMGAACQDDDLVLGFESGADDYIVKPFSMRQLLLRLDAVGRRALGGERDDRQASRGRVVLGDVLIDPTAFEVQKNGLRLTLTRLEFRILYYLTRHAGTLVDTQRLADFAWQSPSAGDSSLLKTHVSHIRQKLAEAGGPEVSIRAVARTGYILHHSSDHAATGPIGAGSVASARS